MTVNDLMALAARHRDTADLRFHEEDGVRKAAVFSPDGVYRYALGRMWTPIEQHDRDRVLVVIGLNPSTATELVDDPTIRRCVGFAKREGFHGLTMLNLFAYRATDPKALHYAIDHAQDIVGGDGNESALTVLTEGRTVLCAWGNHGALCSRDHEVTQRLHGLGRDLRCLGKSRLGAPLHPLYLKSDTPFEAYP